MQHMKEVDGMTISEDVNETDIIICLQDSDFMNVYQPV